MKAHRKRRLWGVFWIVTGLGVAASLALGTFGDVLHYYRSPSDIHAGGIPTDRTIRTGGLVVTGSVQRDPDSLRVRFCVTDGARQLPIQFDGILPDLFREGQGLVITGALQPGPLVHASQVLAKHDETYMPREVAESLKHQGKGPLAATVDGEAAHPDSIPLLPNEDCLT